MKSLTGLLIVLLFSPCMLLAAKITGSVFLDLNGNGTRDQNEAGVKGVAVSDQVNVVVTDANGHFEIQNGGGFGYVFISMPQGYKANRQYYQKIDMSADSRADFPLTKTAPGSTFKFIHASDTHISEKSIDRMTKFRSVVDSIKPDFVVVTGDLIRDALRVPEKEATALYELYKTEIANFTVPVWSAPGNHEIFGIERHLSLVSSQHPLYGRKMFRHFLGPDYYSYNFGGIHFIALNSLEYEDLWYYGSIDSVQMEWLKKDLAVLPPTMPVVTFQHVPFFSAQPSYSDFVESGPARTLENVKGKSVMRHIVSNAHEVIAILKSHPFPLALGGHHHARQRFLPETLGQQTRFEQAAAIIGPAEEGILNMPSGVTLYRVKDGAIDQGVFIPIR